MGGGMWVGGEWVGHERFVGKEGPISPPFEIVFVLV